MRLRQEARVLKEKAVSSMVAAAEAFNSPHDRGRETKVLLHLQHSFEMLLKAALVQKGISVFDPALGRSLGFETCVRKAAEHPDIKLSEPDAGTLRAIDAMRDDEQHWFNQVSEQLLYVPVARAIPSDSWNASSRRIPWHASRSTRGVHQSPSKIHFGGSVTASMHSDRKAAGHLSMASGARSLVMDFRLAPEHPYPAQLDDAETAYRWLLSQGHEPRNIGSTGHSIGGTLAVRLPLRLLTKGEAAPGAIVSVSPWTDLTLQNASVDENEDNDKMLSRNSLELFRAAWLQEPEWTSPPSRSAS